MPPFYREAVGHPNPAAVDATVFLRDGTTVSGHLVGFMPDSLTARVQLHNERVPVALTFASIQSIQLVRPLELVPDEALIQRYQHSSGHTVDPGLRSFLVSFLNGEILQGQTKGFVKARCGLFVFLVTEAGLVVRIFVPEGALQSYRVGKLLGQQLVDSALVDPATLDSALLEQNRRRQLQMDQHLGDGPDPDPSNSAFQWLEDNEDKLAPYAPVRLGDILMEQGLVSHEQMVTALARMKQDPHSLLGNILVEMGALSRSQPTQAVADQLNIPSIVLRDVVIAPLVLALVPKTFAFAHHVLPLLATQSTLVVALESPLNADYLDELAVSSKRQIVPVIAHPEELSARIAAEYSTAAAMTVPASIDAGD